MNPQRQVVMSRELVGAEEQTWKVEGWNFMDVDSTQPPASMLLEFTILSLTEDCQQTTAASAVIALGAPRLRPHTGTAVTCSPYFLQPYSDSWRPTPSQSRQGE